MPLRRVSIILVEPGEAGNLGAVARAMKNFGARELALVRPRCEPLDGMARAFAAGASEILRAARKFDDFDVAIAPYELTIAMTGVQGHHRVLDCVDAIPRNLLEGRSGDARIALVFGREEHGLTNEEANRCAFRWKLPTQTEFPSLNLAQAVGIALFAVAEARRSLGHSAPPTDADVTERSLRKLASLRSRDQSATQEELSRLLDHLRAEMVTWGYEDSVRTDASVGVLRSLFGRANLTHREVQLVRGLLRQAKWWKDTRTPQADTSLLDRLLGHDADTTRELLNCAAALADTDLDREFDIGLRTLRATFVHIIHNMEAWSALMEGRTPARRMGSSVPELLARVDAAAAALAQIAHSVAQRNAWDEKWIDTLDDPPTEKTYGGAIAHVITHSMHHRGQAIHMLKRLGVKGVPEGDVLGWESRKVEKSKG